MNNTLDMHSKILTFDLYNAITVGVCVINSDYQIVYWNDAMAQWTGLDLDLISGKSIMDLFPNFTEPILKERLSSVFRDGLPVVISSKLHPTFFPSIWPQNADALHEIKISSILDEETEQRLAVFTVEDVTDHTRRLFEQRILYKRAMEEVRQRRKAEVELKNSQEKLKEAIATKDKFFSIIAHDLKSPFASLLSYSDYMLTQSDEMDKPAVDMLLQTVNDMAKSGFSLLENLLTWSRVQTGKMQFSPDLFSIKQVTEGLLKLLTFQANEKKISLICNCADDYINADVNMFTTILRNLIANAIKFSHPDSEIIITSEQQENGSFKFRVQDFGIGIDKNDTPKLFDITSHYSMVGTNNETGSGLGLILCKEFVELHNGEIWIESEIGKGTSFFFSIPQ